MPGKSLRSQLNQIRAWVRQGRTDAWIAHQLEVSASELQEFRRQHGLSADDDDAGAADVDLRDEIEAEIEAASADDEDEDEDEDAAEDEQSADGDGDDEPEGGEAEGAPRKRRRRGRRGGRGRRPRQRALEATFDHGEDGYGLWLDPSVQDNAAYAEHWAGHREVTVSIEPEQIVIRRANSDSSSDSDED